MQVSPDSSLAPHIEPLPQHSGGCRMLLAGCADVRHRALLLLLLLTVALAPSLCAPAQCSDMPWLANDFGAIGMDAQVRATLLMPNGDLIAGGDFTSAGGVPANRIARWNGVSWSPLGSGVTGPSAGTGILGFVTSLALLPNGNLVVGGRFDTAGGAPAANIAVWNGTSWSALGLGTDAMVNALAVDAAGMVIAAGDFTSAGGIAANSIARWNGTTWSTLGSGANAGISALAFTAAGDLIAGGNFTSIGGVAASYVARWNGAAWSALTPGTAPRFVNALAVLPNGDIIAGGFFSPFLSRWNGSSWGVMPGGAPSGVVFALTVDSAGDLLVGGQFTTVGAQNILRIARWRAGVWSSLGSGLAQGDSLGGIARAISVAPGSAGAIYAGGDFRAAGGLPAMRIARYLPASIPAPVIDTQPVPMTVSAGANVFFTISANAGHPSLAPVLAYRWYKDGVAVDTAAYPSAATPTLSIPNVQAATLGSYTCQVTNCGVSVTSAPAALSFFVNPCPADFNASGTVTVQDIFDFLAAYFAGC